MSCGTCGEKTKQGVAAAIGSPVAVGGVANVRHCPQCGGFLSKDGQCRRCATIAEVNRGANCTRKSQDWMERWRELGDDMPCPDCGKEQLETQDGITVCRACNWYDKNPLAIDGDSSADDEDEFGHGVTEDLGDNASFELTAVKKKQWQAWVRQAKSSGEMFADDEYKPEVLVINTSGSGGAVAQVLEQIAIAHKANCDSRVVWINPDEVCIYQDHEEAVAQLAPMVGTTEDEWWDAVDGGDRVTVSMWLPGGSMQPMTIAQAHQKVRE